uniref:Predicted protein n=1 Tax=Hordeum vulgare subsp. vulgare TaxID=112509 RepID=F2E1E0_HORVV|nr:predicted protein [Hordeum vulgare subsp. vulgare]BAK01758.1 predicted protein [Hordeum vulgare subsp. vulgare]
MFRRSGGGGDRGKTAAGSTSMGTELPVDGAVRVTKVDRIQAYNLVSRPSVHHAISPATSGPAESLAVSVVRVVDVVDEAVRVTKVDRIQAYNLVSRPSVYHAISPAASGPAESLAVSVVRVGDVVDEESDGVISVSIA